MVITSEYESIYSLKQLENYRMTDDEFYEFCLVNDQIKFERDAFGNSLTLEEQTKFPPLCPDFIIELMSNSDDLRDAVEKMHR
jgi:hypothetical protein